MRATVREGLAMMRAGASASETMRRLIADDPDRDRRQVGLVDARGGAAAHTGKDCFAWAGHIVGEHFACQGNILAGEETVNAMAASFRSSQGALAERLLAALTAGEAAGGDRRGRQSAALYVARERGGYLGFNDVLVDLRVDDHADPVAELEAHPRPAEPLFRIEPAGREARARRRAARRIEADDDRRRKLLG